ncbi:MAG: macro domain-containing protein [Candidatus Auribacterota bacterium]|jgi:O-acetyl-ADP-ribose deacetylase (regulator of RNase III)|nr:macro domain-containing protein [Candidatus Auribacterota bacterium]
MQFYIAKSSIELIVGDITDLDVDAIVNPANCRLKLGGGVAGAILQKGGESIQKECDKIGCIPVGWAVLTGAGNLSAQYVIHAVGPRMGEGDEDEKLQNATLNSLKIAEEYAIESIAFPAISTGIFGYPIKRCAEIMLNVTAGFIKQSSRIKRVVFCLYRPDDYEVFRGVLEHF